MHTPSDIMMLLWFQRNVTFFDPLSFYSLSCIHFKVVSNCVWCLSLICNYSTEWMSVNKPFASSDHVVQNPPCWRASSLLFPHWDIKTKRSEPVKLDLPWACAPAWWILYHVIVTCKRPIQHECRCPSYVSRQLLDWYYSSGGQKNLAIQ